MIAISFFSCRENTKIIYEILDNTSPDKVSLYEIKGKELKPLGDFVYDKYNSYTISKSGLELGLYKLVKHYGTTKKSINFICQGNPGVVSIIDRGDSLFAYGSYETERLFKILNHTRGCDARYFKLQKEMVNNAMDTERTRALLEDEKTIANTCRTDLVNFIRSDLSSIASLYAVDFLDPTLHSELIDSVINESRNKHGELYLHEELKIRLSLSQRD